MFFISEVQTGLMAISDKSKCTSQITYWKMKFKNGSLHEVHGFNEECEP